MTPSRPKIFTARISLILFGILLLGLFEGALRLFWTPPILPEEELAAITIDPYVVQNNQAKTKKNYLGAFREATFTVPKTPGTFRIFCVGGSTTFGYPYAQEAAWPARLERRLRNLFPLRSIEVINAGATSYGSGRTLAVIRGILKYQPDLVLIATGDAEFVEDSFRTAVACPAPVITWLHRLYLSRGLKKILPRSQRTAPSIDAEDQSSAGFLFAPVLSGTVYSVTRDKRSTVMTAFESNLSQMVDVLDGATIPLALMTLPANVASWPPDQDVTLPPEPRQREAWVRLVDEGRVLAAQKNYSGAVQRFNSVAEIWPENARFCYDSGRALLEVGQPVKGKEFLLKAVDLDPTPVRATRAINTAIRSVALEGGVALIDVVNYFEGISPQGIVGEELILDYAHPTPRGHVEIAGVVQGALAAVYPEWQADTAAIRDLHGAELDRVGKEISQVGADQSFVLAQVLERKGLLPQAIKMYQRAIDQGYAGPFAEFGLARLEAGQGDIERAFQKISALVARYPAWTEPYGLLGYLQERRGETIAAIGWYRRAVNAGEKDPALFATLTNLLLLVGDFGQAYEVIEKGLILYPHNCHLAALMGRIFELDGNRRAEAESHYRQRLSNDPTCQDAAENFGILLMGQSRWQEAEQVFVTALSQPAPLPQHYLNLGYVYLQGLSDPSRARTAFDRYQKLNPEGSRLVPSEYRHSSPGAAPNGRVE